MMVLGVLLLQFIQLTLAISQAKEGCQDKCGDLSIPYPFGIGENCFRKGFGIDCNTTHENRSVPYLSRTDIPVTNLSLLMGEIVVNNYVAMDCYDEQGNNLENTQPTFTLGHQSPYTFSDTQNKFTVLGCDTLAYINGSTENKFLPQIPLIVAGFTTGCASYCYRPMFVTNGSCNGFGCCQTSIPKGLKYFNVNIYSYHNHSSVIKFNPCSYAFLTDQKFTFRGLSDLGDYYRDNKRNISLVLDWAIGNQTCEEANKTSDYACVSQNSTCYNSTNGPGYRCNCNAGYEGNPYLHGGCKDIDECKDEAAYPCKGLCTNTQGNYSCECPKGEHSVDPKLYKCEKPFPVLHVTLGIGIPFILILISCWIYLGIQIKKFANLREKYFIKNGGEHMKQLISDNPNVGFKIYSKEELVMATNKFDDKNKLSLGGQGMFFKGVLSDQHTVAIKNFTVVDKETDNTRFANEIFILSKIKHKNVVKLLGCCVEVEIPMLVYEFISNENLFDFIHGGGQLCLNECLRMATEAASALAYLHSDAPTPIIHGDVKSPNILLDKNRLVKVSDFGASKLNLKDANQFGAFVQYSRGYLDPEYFQKGQLTVKSDVYSFGVVLVELLARKKAYFWEGNEHERNLADVFLFSMEDPGRLADLLDHHMWNEERRDLVHEVCKLAKRCLSIVGKERPTMREVVMELERLTGLQNHSEVMSNPEQTGSRITGTTLNAHTIESTDYYTSEKHEVLSIEEGR